MLCACVCVCVCLQNPGGIECTIHMQISSNMTAPIYLYIQLSNFYQNHRRCA